MKKYFKNLNFLIGFIIITLLTFLVILSFFYKLYDVNAINYKKIFLHPSTKHLMGTDNLGRDIFTRIIFGSRVTFIIGITSMLISLYLGVFIGAFMGYYGKIADYIGNKIIEILIIFPKILLALIIVSILGNGKLKIILILSLISLPRFIKITRLGFLQIKELDYIKLSKSKGIKDFRIMFLHILPNLKIPIIVNAALTFSSNILSETGLSYLGMGIEPNIPSWGRMLNESQAFLKQSPWYIFFTSLVIFLLVLGSNLLADGINEISNKR